MRIRRMTKRLLTIAIGLGLAAGVVFAPSSVYAAEEVLYNKDGCKIIKKTHSKNDIEILIVGGNGPDPGKPAGPDNVGTGSYDPDCRKRAERLQSGTKDNTDEFEKKGGTNIDPVTGKAVRDSSVVDYIDSAYTWFAVIGGLLSVISLIYAGYTYMNSYGDPEKIANAKDIVEKTLIGLSLLILAALILNSINPLTTEPCKPSEPGCGDIDFSQPNGGKP